LVHGIVTNFQWTGPNMILGALLMFTVALTQMIENAAVAIILAPIAYQIAREGHADPKPLNLVSLLDWVKPLSIFSLEYIDDLSRQRPIL
jgi:di/tricarboxylate transporter